MCGLRIEGRYDPTPIGTSYNERVNLKRHMGPRRFARLQNTFPNEVKNPQAFGREPHDALYPVRIYETLCCTPAKTTGKLWELADVVQVLEKWEARDRERIGE